MYDAHTSPIVSEGSDAAGDQHILRRISEHALVQSFVDLLAERNVYMADGHHRYESALAARDERPASNFVLMGILRDSDDGLNVGATHRVIHADAPADLPARLAASFNVAGASLEVLDSLEPGSVDLGLITASGAYLLQPTDAPSTMPATVPGAWRNLAPAILQYAILEPLLGIGDQELAGGQAVSYTHYVSEAAEAVRKRQRLGSVHPARRDVAGRDRDIRRPAASCRRRAPTSCPSSPPAWSCTRSTDRRGRASTPPSYIVAWWTSSMPSIAAIALSSSGVSARSMVTAINASADGSEASCPTSIA